MENINLNKMLTNYIPNSKGIVIHILSLASSKSIGIACTQSSPRRGSMLSPIIGFGCHEFETQNQLKQPTKMVQSIKTVHESSQNKVQRYY